MCISLKPLKASMDAVCQCSLATLTLSSTIDAHLLQAQPTNQEAPLQAHWHQRPCCCSRTELQVVMLQAHYEGELAVRRVVESLLKDEMTLLSNMVRAGSLRRLPAQAS